MTLSVTFYNNMKYTKDDFMNRDRDFFGNGVVQANHFDLAFPATPDLTFQVGAGVAWVDGYRIANDDSTMQLAVDPADAQPRIDIVQIGHDDVRSQAALVVKKGVPSAAPIEPGADVGFLKLYAIAVPAGAKSITSASITDRRALVPLKVSGTQIQYGGAARADQAQTWSAAQTFSQPIASTLADGTAPLTVASKTKVANLNADQVDGYDFNQSLKTTDSVAFNTVAASAVTLGNNQALFGKETGGASRTLAYMGSDNKIYLGNSSNAVLMQGTSVTLPQATTAKPFTSTLADGTAPFTITSKTMVPNLNADTVDGKHATDLALRTASVGAIGNNLLDPNKLSFSRASSAYDAGGNKVPYHVLRTAPGRYGAGAYIEEGTSNLVANPDFETVTGTAVVFSDAMTSSAAWTVSGGTPTWSASGATAGTGQYPFLTAGNKNWKPLAGSAAGGNLVLTFQATFKTGASLAGGYFNVSMAASPNYNSQTRYYAEVNAGSNLFYIAKQLNGGTQTVVSTSATPSAAITANGQYTIQFSIDVNNVLTAKLYNGVGTGGTVLASVSVTDTSIPVATNTFLLGLYITPAFSVSNASVTAPMPQGWSIGGESRIAWGVTANPMYGSYALSASGFTGSATGYVVSSTVPVSLNVPYTLSTFTITNGVSSSGVYGAINWTGTGTNDITPFAPSTSSNPQRLTKTATPPSNATGLIAGLDFADAGTVVFERVQVEQKGYATSYTDSTRQPDSLSCALNVPIPAAHFGCLVWRPDQPSSITNATNRLTLWSSTARGQNANRHIIQYKTDAKSFQFYKTPDNGITSTSAEAPMSYSAGDTVFIAWRDDPASSGNMDLFIGINGGPLTKASASSTTQIADAQTAYVGCRSVTGFEANGTIDFPLLSDSIPTDEQVTALYQSAEIGGARMFPNPTQLLKQPDWIAPTLVNGWGNYSAAYAQAGYMKDSLGFVHLKGLISGGVAASGTTLFTLPSGYRPKERLTFATDSNGSYGRVDVLSTGDVIIIVGNNGSLTLNIPPFRAD